MRVRALVRPGGRSRCAHGAGNFLTSKKITIGSTAAELSHLKPELFFGYILSNGRQVAEPEKALLDQLYLVSRGRVAVRLEELDLRLINKGKLTAYASKFPRNMKPLLDKIEKYLGTTPITLEAGERIKWDVN